MAKRRCIKWKYYFMLVLYQPTTLGLCHSEILIPKFGIIVSEFQIYAAYIAWQLGICWQALRCNIVTHLYYWLSGFKGLLLYWSMASCCGKIPEQNNQEALRIEPPRDKTNKMTVRPAKIQISLGIRPVWSEPSLCTHWVAKDPSFLHADSEASDQTGQMPRLIWVFAGRTTTLLVLSWGISILFEWGLRVQSRRCIWIYWTFTRPETNVKFNPCMELLL